MIIRQACKKTGRLYFWSVIKSKYWSLAGDGHSFGFAGHNIDKSDIIRPENEHVNIFKVVFCMLHRSVFKIKIFILKNFKGSLQATSRC